MKKPVGLYERLLTRADASEIDALTIVDEIEPHRTPSAIAKLIHERALEALRGIEGEKAVALANTVLELLEDSDRLELPPRELRAVLEDVAAPAKPTAPVRPAIPLSTSDLLVNGPHDVSLGPQLQRELASVDRVDVLCSFLKWSGLRLVEAELRALKRGRVRVLTTAYMKATERRALDALKEMGAEVRVSYDTTRTRLHAKAWLLHRASGYSTAYVGSSNLSAAAMLDGLEWNVRLSAIDNGPILEKFASTFEQYWEDPSFRPYDANEFDEAVEAMQRDELAPFLIVDIRPRPHQEEVLEQLAAEREKGHTRNLVVAATGTGKTIVAALDYRRLHEVHPRLLFVAHRQEILEQSWRTFQVVMRDGAFGELLVAEKRPDRWNHVFASVQSLHADQLREIPRDQFDVLIVDEFHHAAADTYEALLEHFQPKILLGLTATPERADGQSILHFFDGRVASELRLWKALDQGLLSPFQYFGIGGAPNATGVTWSRGRYSSSELSNVYTADHAFAKRVLREVARIVSDPRKMRALGFCVDVAHAEFMTKIFNDAGIASAAVSASTRDADRRARLSALRSGELRCIFSVDLFNEGVDLPDVDTVLFLRPTESATVFLQQLGRGLRRSDTKECLTVLDFIGDANRQFRFDLRYRAIVGGTRRSIEREIEDGFPSLPSGCTIKLDRQAQQAVLTNIRQQLGSGIRGLLEDLRGVIDRHGMNVSLATFLEEAKIDLDDLYTDARCWTSLRRKAEVKLPARGPDDDQTERALARVLHVDDVDRLDGIRAFLKSAQPIANDKDAIQRFLFVLLGYVKEPYSKMKAAWSALWQSTALRDELEQLLALLADRSRKATYPLAGALAALPLRVHGTYTLDEILAGVDERTTKGGVKRIQTGVFHHSKRNCDLLFVTLEKSEKEYSPTTLYNDSRRRAFIGSHRAAAIRRQRRASAT